MAFIEKQLAQARPGSTPAAIYTCPSSTRAIAKSIMVTNTTNVDKTFSLFIDNDGNTYNATTAIFFNTVLRAKESKLIDSYFVIDTAGGSIGASASDVDVTFTVSGGEVS